MTTPAEPDAVLALRAGEVLTTWRAGRLGPVEIAGHEVWHGVHFLLRDPHWRTPALQIGAPVFEPQPASAGDRWRFVAEGRFDETDSVRVRITIEGGTGGAGGEAPPATRAGEPRDPPGAAGMLLVTGEAFIERDIDVNRLGLCLLHPLSAAGRALEIGHDDGRLTRSTFPRLVPAWPPFNAIRSFRHEFAPGAWAVAEFDGDDFELEDQRNNADASFKTYSRSNFMPRPYRLRAGDVVRQRVCLRVDRPAAAAPPAAAVVARPARAPAAGLPVRVGVEVTRDELEAAGPARSEAAATLAALRPDHLHVTLPGDGRVPDAAALAALLRAAGPQAGLRLDVVDLAEASAAAALERLGRGLREAGLVGPPGGGARFLEVAVFPTTAAAVQAARAAFPGASVGGGTRDFFVQLNRAERLPPLDFLAFTVCPIVHAADDATVMLGHASVAGMIATLGARHPGVPVHLGPSSIAARRSPLGELAASDGTRRVPLAGTDPRERTAFGAAWVAAHVAAAIAAGVPAVTVSRLSLCGDGSPTRELLARLGRRRRPGGLRAAVAGSGSLVLLEVDAPEGPEQVWTNTGSDPGVLAVPTGARLRWQIGAGGTTSDAGTLTLAPHAVVAMAATTARA